MNLSKKQNNKGFSLIELMVAVSIFAIVMLIGTGAILAIVNGNKKNQSMQVAISNLNYAVENMTRNMKTGRGFNTNGLNEINFITTEGDNVTYSLSDLDPEDKQSLQIDYGDGVETPITAPEIDIDRLEFTTVGTLGDDELQPAIIILIEGTATNAKSDLQTTFSIHTSVTQRAVDF